MHSNTFAIEKMSNFGKLNFFPMRKFLFFSVIQNALQAVNAEKGDCSNAFRNETIECSDFSSQSKLPYNDYIKTQ